MERGQGRRPKQRYIALFLLLACLAAGCGRVRSLAAAGFVPEDEAAPAAGEGSRDAAAQVLVPQAPGTTMLGNQGVSIDVSNAARGYICVSYLGSNPKVKLQITREEGRTYTYNLHRQTMEVFPLSQGDGLYRLNVFESIPGKEKTYTTLYSQTLELALENKFIPFLHPNQYVNFAPDSEAVAQGERLAAGASEDLDVVARVYEYVVGNIRYDYDLARSVQPGYLPDVDRTLSTQKGICFDYAALMTAMLRSQRIPARLVIGYAGELYHAWISVYIEGRGWIHNIIYFDGVNWVLMDPTFAASGTDATEYVGDGGNYNAMYLY